MLSVEFVADVAREILVAPGSLSKLPHGFKKVYHEAQWRNHQRWARNPHVVRSAKGFRIKLDGNPDTPLYFNVGVAGVYEPHITSLFHKLLRPGMTVLDVGTNAGWYTLLSARAVGPSGRVLSFEPEPSNYAALTENVTLNGFRNVTTYDVALFDQEDVRPLSISSTASAWHSMVLPVGDSTVQVRTTRLDTLLASSPLGKVDLLKIDVEGAEPNVLLGAPETVEKTDHLVIEWNPQVWTDRQDLLDRLFDRFRVFQIRYAPSLLRPLERPRMSTLVACNLYLRSKRLPA